MTAKTLALLIASSLLLAGCGNKGPLVLPPAPVADDVPLLEDVPPAMDSNAPPQLAPEADAEVDPDADASKSGELPDPPAAPAVR